MAKDEPASALDPGDSSAVKWGLKRYIALEFGRTFAPCSLCRRCQGRYLAAMLGLAARCAGSVRDSARLRWLTWVMPLAWASSSVAWAQAESGASERQSAPQAQMTNATVSEQDKAQARRLGSEAFAALDDGDYARAVKNFTRALTHYDAPTLRLGRAEALKAQGTWLAALEDLRRAAGQAAMPGEPASFPRARAEAKARQSRLESRLPSLVVRAPEGAEVRVDGQLWSHPGPRPLDPGEHQVTVRADGQTSTRTVKLAEGARETVAFPGATVTGAVQAGAEETTNDASDSAQASATPVPGIASGAAGVEPVSERAVEASSPGTSESDGGNVALAAAATTTAVLTVAAVVTGWVALGARSDYDDENRPDVSRSRKQELRSAALTWSWVNTAATAGAVIAGGVTAYLWLSPPAVAPSAEAAGPWLVGVSGSF